MKKTRSRKSRDTVPLSQLELAKTAKKHFLHYKIIEASKKLKQSSLPLHRSKTNHTYIQKPNPSRETVL
jgi:hypothetical protein